MKIIEMYLPIYSLSSYPTPKDNLAIFKCFQEYMVITKGLKITPSVFVKEHLCTINQYRYSKEV